MKLTYFGREFEDIRFDPSKDVRLDHLVQFLNKAFVEVGKPRLEIRQVPTKRAISTAASAPYNFYALEGLLVQEVQQVEQLPQIIVQRIFQ